MGNSVERYYQKKKKRKKRTKIIFISMLVALMMLVLVVLSVTVFFNAETILVEGNTHYTAETLLEQGGLKVGQNLFRLDKFEVIEKMQKLPYVKEVTIDRKLPNTLEITVVENQPVVWVETATGVALMNEEFRVLELLDLPKEVLPPISKLEESEEKEAAKKLSEQESAESEQTNEESEETQASEEPEAESEETQASEEPEAGTEETQASEEALPVYSQLEEAARLVGLTPNKLEVGQCSTFKEGDYEGFLLRLYESFCVNPDLQWDLVDEVQFKARYDVKLLYDARVTIVLGTLDQVETKLDLAAYVLNQNGGTAQAATVDVSDTKRQYYRPETA